MADSPQDATTLQPPTGPDGKPLSGLQLLNWKRRNGLAPQSRGPGRPRKEEAVSGRTTEAKPSFLPPPKLVVFKSREPEPYQWDMCRIKSRRCPDDPERIEWHVPADQAENFANHWHCKRGRVVRA